MTIHILRDRATPEQVAEMLEALQTYINIRPRQNNRTMVIQDSKIRQRVESLVRWMFAGVQ